MVCRRAFSSGFWKHVQEAHQQKKEEYLNTHGKAGIEIVHYVCRICDKKIPWFGASINSHTKADHGMTLKEYEVQYPPPQTSHTLKREIKTEPGKNFVL